MKCTNCCLKCAEFLIFFCLKILSIVSRFGKFICSRCFLFHPLLNNTCSACTCASTDKIITHKTIFFIVTRMMVSSIMYVSVCKCLLLWWYLYVKFIRKRAIEQWLIYNVRYVTVKYYNDNKYVT